MGSSTTASGEYSTAMGYNAKAIHDGSFVWGDRQATDFPSIINNEFAIRAAGGVRIANSGSGATLLRFETERAWVFRQLDSGASTALELATENPDNPKNFVITANNVGINTTVPTFTLQVNGTAGKSGGGSWSTASDARLKDVGQPFTRGLDDLEQIQPTHYHYSEDNALKLPSDREYIGLIAQNVQASIPEAIDANDSGYLHVNNDPILWTMLNGIKELNGKLENELEQKDFEIKKLEQRLERLEQLLTPQN